MVNIVSKQIIPAVIRYTTELANSICAVKDTGCGADVSTQTELLNEVSDLLAATKQEQAKLQEDVAKGIAMEDNRERALYYHEVVSHSMSVLRASVDRLEFLVDKDVWPMPSYGDMLFEV